MFSNNQGVLTMKNKLHSILTTTAATLATVVMGATSASAASLYETLLPYTPTTDSIDGLQSERGLKTGVNLFETALPDFSNLDADYDSVDVMFLGEAAGYKNTLQLSVNGTKTSIFENIQAYSGEGALLDKNGKKSGTFDSKYNGLNPKFLDIGTVWNSKTAGIQGLSQGNSLNFWLNPDGDATKALNMGSKARKYGNVYSDLPLFKAYQLKGFEEWTILAAEDIDYWKSPHIDHNDLVFAVKLNPAEDIPEPSTTLALLGVGAAGLVLRRKSLTK